MKKVIITLILLSLVFVAGCGSKESSNQTSQTSAVEKPKYSASDCSVLNLEDIKAVFNTQDVTQEKNVNDANACSKGWKTWKIEGTSKSPLNAMAMIMTKTVNLSTYDYKSPSSSLDMVCGRSPSISLGDYKSCNLLGDIYFGKGDYLVEIQCIDCSEGNGLSLAKTVESRM